MRLGELGLAEAIHPQLEADEESAALFVRLRDLDAEYELDVPAWRLGLETLARGLRRDEVHALLHRLNVPKRDARHIAAAVVDGPSLGEQLRDGGLTASEIVGSPSPTIPTRRSSPSRSPTSSLCASTSTACSTSSSRSAAGSSRSSAWASRRGWARSSASYGAES